jgi:hypothetical protein
MKLDEQSPLIISADKDKNGNYIPSSIHMSFDDPQINEAICSYLGCQKRLDLISHEKKEDAVIESEKVRVYFSKTGISVLLIKFPLSHILCQTGQKERVPKVLKIWTG